MMEIEEYEEQFKRQKAEISGLNRKVSDLTNELQKVKGTDPLSEKEKELNAREKKLDLQQLCSEEDFPQEILELAASIYGAERISPELREQFKDVTSTYKESALEEFKAERIRNAHIPRGNGNDDYPETYNDLIRLPDNQIANLPDRIIKRAMNRGA